MEKLPPPLLGFNNNVRHHGRMFHIQTEDSGVRHARIVTHLFADGGRILRTTRTDYTDKLGHKDMVELLRRLMKQQHKAMFIALRSGELDAAIAAALGSDSSESSEHAAERGLLLGLASAAAKGRERAAPDPDDTIPIASGLAPDHGGASSVQGESTPHGHPSPAHEKAHLPKASPDGARPASLFELPMVGPSLFNEGVLCERSLDDTILSYLDEEEGELPSEE